MTVETLVTEAFVGDQVGFVVSIENRGDADLTGVLVELQPSANARLLGGAIIDGDGRRGASIGVDLGETLARIDLAVLPAGSSTVRIRLVAVPFASGQLQLTPSIISSPGAAQSIGSPPPSVRVLDQEDLVVTIHRPLPVCGSLAAAPLVLLAGLCAVRLRPRFRVRNAAPHVRPSGDTPC